MVPMSLLVPLIVLNLRRTLVINHVLDPSRTGYRLTEYRLYSEFVWVILAACRRMCWRTQRSTLLQTLVTNNKLRTAVERAEALLLDDARECVAHALAARGRYFTIANGY